MHHKIISLIVVLFTISCSAQATSKKIQITSNKNIDVLFTIYNQTWTPFLDENVSEYTLERTRLMKLNYERFESYKNHKAIELTNKIMGRSGTDFFSFGFYYDTFPDAKRIKEIPERVLKDINPDTTLALEEIDALMSEIAKFYEDSDYDSFLKENQYIYEKAKQEVAKKLPDDNFIPFLESYFGKSYNSYDFIIIPFFKSQYGQAGKEDSGIYCIVSPFDPQQIDAQGKVQNVGFDNRTEIQNWTIHEYSHLFFNPVMDIKENLDGLNAFDHLFKPIESNPQYGDWYSIFAEHLANAFQVRATSLIDNEQASNEILKKLKNEGWYYIDHFIDQLKKYEDNRNTYPTIDAFIPDLIKSLHQIKSE